MHVNVIQKQRREFLGNNIYMCPLYKVVRDGEKKLKITQNGEESKIQA